MKTDHISMTQAGSNMCVCGEPAAAHPSADEVLPTVCNCTQDGLPYCGQPECDIDWCYACGDEYSEPCPRHTEVGRT